MDFSFAVHALQLGHNVARNEWPLGNYLTVQVPDEHSLMTEVYIYLTDRHGKRIPWTPAQADLFAGDWIDVDVVNL